MTFDIRAFWLIGALAGGGFGLLVLIVRNAYPDYLYRVLSLWGAAQICLAASYIVRLGRAWEVPFIFHVVSCTLVAACLSLEYWAVRELKRQQSSIGWIFAPPLLMFATCTWFTLVQRNITVELIIFNFINMAMMLLIARSLWRTEDGRRPFADTVTATVYSLLATVTCGVIVDIFWKRQFSPEYDFNTPRSIFNCIAAVVSEGLIFPLFLLMLSERLNHDLEIQAMCDPLTGLYNRRAFEEIAFREMAGASRTRLGLSVLMLDIDHFKQVNDLHGHAAGDAMLVAVSATLRSGLRDEDFLCRWGGDEFCALLPRATSEQAMTVAERVLQAFQKLDFSLEGTPIEVSVSIGITTDECPEKNVSALVGRADAALYQAKEAGRRRFAFVPKDIPESGSSLTR
jgi:diguanylate cyclase (GGDEF)-like protein